ncbi:MAG: geranylgeranylglycerol-phosphate geranylgeranyltransferase [Candidatus Hadarchaeota archaeon]
MSPTLELARPLNCAITGLAVVIGSAVAIGPLRVLFWPLIIPFMAAAIVAAGGNAINDYFDWKIDKVNRPGRPIPSGRLTAEEALKRAQALFAVGVFLSAFLGFFALALAAANSLVLVAYSWRLKRRGLVGNLAIGYLTGSTFLFGSFAANFLFGTPLISAELSVLALMAGLSTVGRELIKGIQDMPGDKKMGLKTFPLEHGARKAAALAIVFILAAVAVSPVPYFLGIFGWAYLALVAVSIAAFIAAVLIIAGGKRSAGRASLACKVGMALGLLAFLAGAVVRIL